MANIRKNYCLLVIFFFALKIASMVNYGGVKLEEIKAGAAKIDITPPTSVKGSFRRVSDKKAAGVHDNIYAKALVLSNKNTKIAIIACDVVGFFRHYVNKHYFTTFC